MRRDVESFETFRERSNAIAPTVGTARALGVARNGNGEEDARKDIRAEIDSVLSSSPSIDEDATVTLRDLLLAKIEPFLPNADSHAPLSMLDSVTLGLTNDEDIKAWLKRKHSIDISTVEDLKYIDRILEEAIQFFDEHVVSQRGKGNKICGELRRNGENIDAMQERIYSVFKIASGFSNRRKVEVPQACALLRIAAVINFIENDPRIALVPEADKALTEIVRKHVKKDKDGNKAFVSGLPNDPPFPVIDFKLRKKPKERWRIIAKLLHKASNRTEEVLDQIGFRVITKDLGDVYKLIYKMFFHPKTAIFPSENIHPGETRNLILDANKVLELSENPEFAKGLLGQSAVALETGDLKPEIPIENDNPHSGKGYGAVNIIFNLPIIMGDGKRSFFPVEFQIIDRETADRNPPHEEYEGRQMRTVTDRILGRNLSSEYEESIGTQK